MLARYEDLTSLSVLAEDGSTHPVRDLLIDDRSLAATYAVADVGGWFSEHDAMIGLDRFAEPDIAGGRWPARLDRAALERRPEPVAAGGGGDASSGLVSRLLGPVGGTPPLGTDSPAVPGRPDPEGRTDAEATPRSLGDFIADTEVAADDGPVGTLMDVILDTADWRLRHLVIGTDGGTLPKNQRVVPSDLIASVDWQAGAIRLDCPADRVHASPDLHEMDGLAGKWWNAVAAYYGFRT